MSKIWTAVKKAWIFNLGILLVGIILVGGEIKTVNSKPASTRGDSSTRGGQSTIDNTKITIDNIQITSSVNNKQITDNNQQKITYKTQTATENVVVPTPEQPTQVLDAKKAEVIILPSAQMSIEGLGSYRTNIATDETAFTLLIKTAAQNNFKINYKLYSFGAFIAGIGSINPTGNEFWALYYNGQSSQVGASQLKVKNGDNISWRIEKW